MARDDLLALSDDDLARLSNRGRVNAARKELDDGRLYGELVESAEGAVAVRWADGRSSEVPAHAALGKARCQCGEPGVCKHVVALVLLYQRQQERPAPPSGPWDPGAIGDDALARDCRPQTLARARQLFDEGILAELVRGTQPLARFHLPVCTVRFLLPGLLGYARCNCAKPAPCEHVALAVWAFRLLPADRRAGIVTAGADASAVPPDLLVAVESALSELAEQGVSGSAKGTIDRLSRVAARCEESGLIWPPELLRELLTQLECYQKHDARFDPAVIASRVGELAARLDAIRAASLPALLLRGGAADRPVDLEPGEFWGLGCSARPGRRGVALAAYLYDRKSGGVVAIADEVNESARPEERLPPLGQLGDRSAVHGLAGASFRAVGGGVLKLATGRRTARHELLPGRERRGLPGPNLAVQDRLAWEEIEPPVYVEDFGELLERMSLLPPSCFRPRRVAEDFHVLRVVRVEEARFDPVSHVVRAILFDVGGGRAFLEHDYTTRGRAGVESLLARLTQGPGELRFVAGSVRRSSAGLIVRPAALVWQDGEQRSLLQPWIERDASVSGEQANASASAPEAESDFLTKLNEQLGELFVTGLQRADAASSRAWADLARHGESAGFARLGAKVNALAARLEQKSHTLQWEAGPASALLLEMAVLARLAEDV